MVVAELFAKLGLKVDKKSWSVGNDVIAGLGKALVVWMGVKAVQGIGGWVKATMEAGDAAVKTAQKIGITSDAVQELTYAAGQSGTDVHVLQGALSRLASGMADAAKTGKGPLVDGLHSIGLSMKALKGETLDQNLEAIANQISKMPEGAKKIAAVRNIFGKTGTELLPLLNAGASGIAELRNEAHKLGFVIEEDNAKAFETFGDDIDRVKTTLVGFRNQAVTALLPVLQEMATKLLNWLKDADNRAKVISVMTALINGLATAIRVVANAIAFVVDHWEVFAALLAGTVVVTAIFRIIKLMQFLALESTKAAIKTLIAWGAAAAPFVGIALVIAAIVLGFTKYRKQAVQIIDAIKKKAKELWDAIPRGFRLAFEIISNLPIIKQLVWLVKEIGKFASNPKQYAKDLGGRVKEGVKDAIFGGGGSGFAPGADLLRKAVPDAAAPVKPIDAGSGGSVSMTVGDINIVQQPGEDAAALGERFRGIIREENDKMLRHAYAGTGVG